MTSCSQLEDIEALVFGEIDPARAPAVRAHAERCAACREELEMLSAERALFAQRAEVMPLPPPALASVATSPLRPLRAVRSGARIAAAVVQLVRRGHFTAACAAALFVVAAFSRPGGGTRDGIMIASPSQIVAEGDGASSGILASTWTEESLACSNTSSPSATRDDLGDPSSSSALASIASRASLSSLDGVLACGGAAGARDAREGSFDTASCAPSVTCSSLRQ